MPPEVVIRSEPSRCDLWNIRPRLSIERRAQQEASQRDDGSGMPKEGDPMAPLARVAHNEVSTPSLFEQHGVRWSGRLPCIGINSAPERTYQLFFLLGHDIRVTHSW